MSQHVPARSKLNEEVALLGLPTLLTAHTKTNSTERWPSRAYSRYSPANRGAGGAKGKMGGGGKVMNQDGVEGGWGGGGATLHCHKHHPRPRAHARSYTYTKVEQKGGGV